jgi:hypothetical protein
MRSGVISIMKFALDGLENSKDGLTTYAEDSEADHGDGQQVGRETAYKAVIKECAKLLEKY